MSDFLAVPEPDLVRCLLEPGAYPAGERPMRVALVQTHISWRKELAGIGPEEPRRGAWGEGIYSEASHRRNSPPDPPGTPTGCESV